MKTVVFGDYLKHMQQMWQTLSMAKQLQRDTVAGNHKYMAHQVALLYQSLSMPNLKLQPLKKKIEPQFEGIKKQTESSKGSPAALLSAQRWWLMGLTGEVADEITGPSNVPSRHINDWFVAFAQK
eukprot:CAMPEP_0173078966 /NCGR_PEP_ID=MMETSP1102-20130122/14675_1 /TAXON_ID=49646 /ORGANISM="Geminigera sp., Strain Caron Lab Isolate" /LENGTH=124 /DNA_ID=CAMNT_0013950823 /DNA_START=1 /DNA_END=375 /DNA_ORIENTATION=+